MEISVANRQRKTGISTKHVRLLARRVLENESARFDEISVNFLGASAVRSLNLKFTGRDDVTDVLAFEISPDRMGGCARLGDVVVCADRAAEQALDYGVELNEELARLTIHGLLHLCGMDDGTPAQKARMRRREDHYLKRLEELVRHVVTTGAGGSRGRRPSGSAGKKSRA